MDCDEEREGYVNPVRPAYPPIHTSASQSVSSHQARAYHFEETLGALITAAGGIWAVYMVILQRGSFWQLQWPPTPAEICGVGLLILLHAKWRHAAKAE